MILNHSHLIEYLIPFYIKEGKSSLVISFGCTGGQHRSVYCAQHLAEHLNEKYGIEVHITHREQGIRQTLNAR